MSNIDMNQLITAEDRAAELARERRHAEQTDAQRFLARTDWYVMRASETGIPVPDEIQEARRAARHVAGG